MRKLKLFSLLAGLLLSVGMRAGGSCGGGLTWELTGTSPNYTLTISGSGAMYDYSSFSNRPWHENSYYLHIKTVVIGDDVTYIGKNAFYSFSSLTDVNFSTSGNLKAIGDYAFQSAGRAYQSNLPINLPEGLESIGENTFSFARFTSFNLPSTLKTIGNVAFGDNSSLNELTIPASVTSIGYGITNGCYGMTSITVESGNSVYASPNNCNAIITQAAPITLVAGCNNTTIPSNVKVIGKQAFLGMNIEIINIPEGVETLAYKAFSTCRHLTTINIPSTVNSIGDEAFSFCSNLSTITVASENTTFESPDNCNAIIEKSTHKLKLGCKNTTFPEGVSIIDGYAFYNVTTMEEITFPSTLTKIEPFGFYNCTGIKKITCLSTTHPVIDVAYSFSGLSNKSEVDVYVPAGSYDDYANNYAWSQFHLIASEPCEYAGEMEGGAHWEVNRCTGELTITCSDPSCSMPYFWNEDDVPWKDKKEAITDITISKDIMNISEYAFSNCPNLESVTFETPSQVKIIDNEAFANCPKLTEITLPESLENIDSYAFNGCNNLAHIAFKSPIPPISGLWSEDIRITYPNEYEDAYVNNELLMGSAYSWWNNLYNETTGEHAPAPHGSGTTGDLTWEFTMAYDPNRFDINPNFEDLRGTLTISGSGAIPDASSGPDWPEYYVNYIHYIAIEDGVTAVGDNAFFGALRAVTVNIPATVTNIKKDAFRFCGAASMGVSIYIAANPANLIWEDDKNDFIILDGYSEDEALMKAAHCYVPAQYIAGYQEKTNVNVVFVPSGLSDISDAETINGILTELNGEVIEEATITRPVPRDGFFFTLCVPFDISASDISISTLRDAEIMVFEDAEFTGEVINAYFTRTYGGIEAGKPYFVRFPSSTSLDKLDFSNVTVRNIDPIPVKRGNVTMIGTYVPKHLEQQSSATDGEGLLFLVSENQLKWPEVAGDIKPFRCYFKVTLGGGAGAPRRGTPARIIVRDNSTTGFENAQNCEIFNGKIMENGQLVIFHNGVKYNAAGQIVK